LTTSSAQVRLRFGTGLAAAASERSLQGLAGGSAESRTDALARLLAVDAWTDRTLAGLRAAGTEPRRLLALGLVSPEYVVS
jgi:hypothetical protein